ncbi:cyclase family protein [Streptomyces sp. SID13031]|uniref:cyclase family protein n=1 Tax=Streptomyces sp. SID13031 TaxID=2706046 RepID=UPI0013CC7080|nr:cyclase family protein [Streptomyces sp. SID13031]NEA34694.1 cyclase family protein [Streptomyces sp. SID13031]
MPSYRARFDATVTFTNGGGLQVHGFLVDVPSAEVTSVQVGELFLDSLGLLMAGEVQLANLEIVEAAHKGTRGGPAADGPASGGQAKYVELNHVIRDGMVTLPNLPGPVLGKQLTREASREIYAPGTEFEIGLITMVTNTGTYLDSPYHRYPDGHDLTGYTLDRTADLPAVVVRLEDSGSLGIDAAALATYDVRGKAVLLHTGDDARFNTPQYVEEAHFLTRDGAEWLIANGAVLVGIDAANIDDMTDGTRPAHTLLLGAGIGIVEHLTSLAQVPPTGATFTATAPRIAGLGTFPVRAYAKVG